MAKTNIQGYKKGIKNKSGQNFSQLFAQRSSSEKSVYKKVSISKKKNFDFSA